MGDRHRDAGLSSLDRFSNFIIEGERYPIASLVRLEGQPPRRGDGDDS